MQDSLEYVLNKWQLINIESMDNVSVTNNYVVKAYSAYYKKYVVLKIISISKNFHQELQALQYFQSDVCVKLLDFDETYGALLLQYVQPGASLKDLFLQGQEKESIAIFAQILTKLHTKQESSYVSLYPTMAQRLGLLKNFNSIKFSPSLLQEGWFIAEKLLSRADKNYLLHGDLHHENILQADNRWVIIDPQGVVGPFAAELGAFIRNPIFSLLDQENPEQIIQERINTLHILLDIDKQLITDWSFVQAVLAACYAEQDGHDAATQYFAVVAQIMHQFLYID